jgi:hypothetical protein
MRPSAQAGREKAKINHESLPETRDRLVERACRAHVLEEAIAAYAAIAADPDAIAEWRAEIMAWDVTVGDGLASTSEHECENLP